MKLALEALENSVDLVSHEARNAEELYGKYPSRLARIQGLVAFEVAHEKAITALREALAEQPARPYRQLQDNGSKYFGESWDKPEQPAQQEPKIDIYRSFEQWKSGNVLEHGVPRTEHYSEAQLDLVEMGWNYGYDAGRAVEQALDKKAENARELGLDYEPARDSGIVTAGGADPRTQRTWVGLSDEEYIDITDSVYHKGQGLVAYYKAIESKLKEKNNG